MRILNLKTGAIQRRIALDHRVSSLLGRLKAHHPETYGHSIRVGLLSTDLALELEVNAGHLRILGLAACLHDIGKLKLSSEILAKPSRLTGIELEQSRLHPRYGFEMLSKMGLINVRRVIVAHHEFQPISYPRQNRRTEETWLERLTQILVVSDVFDSLSSPRSYKPALDNQTIVELMSADFQGDSDLLGLIWKRL